ncbi:hypothetical protein U9M48_033545 [Paspalum notatum var. saurae]|uniref:Uncharacterized protein n=1 Tax=Paspalum notatum var. saurae TaxID=547442 RepID=A0AAQ3U778_PASNO
MDQRRSSR